MFWHIFDTYRKVESRQSTVGAPGIIFDIFDIIFFIFDTNFGLYKWSKYKKPFISAPERARTVLSVFFGMYVIGQMCWKFCKSMFIFNIYVKCQKFRYNFDIFLVYFRLSERFLVSFGFSCTWLLNFILGNQGNYTGLVLTNVRLSTFAKYQNFLANAWP